MTVKGSSKVLAILAYALWFVGGLLVLLTARNDRFAVYHARQSLGLSLAVIMAPVAWLVFGWLVAWVPSVGIVISAGSFALVIFVYIVAAVAWIAGLTNAARARLRPVPFFGDWANRLPR